MPSPPRSLQTPRLRLRHWRETDGAAFAALHADPDVMQDMGGPIGRDESDRKFDRYREAWERCGYGRWAVETHAGDFLGYVGVMPHSGTHPLGPHSEIGWRLNRRAWGQGYASEAARTALSDVFARTDLAEVVSYTAADNRRSQAVMARLRLHRDLSRDFTVDDGSKQWRGLVWVALRQSVPAAL